ncbi:GDPmannose 4,6-dehydratase [Lachnospiraceae bacterium NE2001]|nr:GDPmannose 4,6-dehydratase [Lachnospiraceae bacterium NE2001]
MRVLITGSEGFIGKYLSEEFERSGYDVVRCSFFDEEGYIQLDIMNVKQVFDTIKMFAPDIIVNLAGQANVGLSWEKPQITMELNIVGFINILEAVKKINSSIRIIGMGSSDEYGVLREKGVDVKENTPINPINLYAVSKVAQEKVALLYNKTFDMNICMIRQFNLIGAGQAKGFMVPDFASGIVEVEIGKKPNLLVGNLESARDFTYVKDAVKAIRLIAEKGHSGEIYNICSGITYKTQDILDKLLSLSTKKIEVRKDSSKMRPSDTPVVCGNHDKLTAHTGWIPETSVDDVLVEVIDYWRKQLAANK